MNQRIDLRAIDQPVSYHELAPNRFAVDGTPADCVITALIHILNVPPVIVISGVNRGCNLGSDILYSGTVAAASEAALQGIPAIAVSAHPGADCTAAVHTHAPIATAFGIANQKFPPINTDAVFLADTVTVPWYMPGSVELAEAVGEAMKKSKGCILQNHGLMTVGPNLRKAATRAMLLEETAKIVLYTKQFGGTVSLVPDDWIERLAAIAEFV
jgi:hypothetical protein